MLLIANNRILAKKIPYTSNSLIFEEKQLLEHSLYAPIIVENRFCQPVFRYISKKEGRNQTDYQEKFIGLFIKQSDGILDFFNIMFYAFNFPPLLEQLQWLDTELFQNSESRIKVKMELEEALQFASDFIGRLGIET
jgi:hypothetical protein